jgi:hypothetical protein
MQMEQSGNKPAARMEEYNTLTGHALFDPFYSPGLNAGGRPGNHIPHPDGWSGNPGGVLMEDTA